LLLSKGVITRLPDVPGSAATIHFRVNNRGDIVGAFGLAPGTIDNPAPLSSFSMRGRELTAIDVPGADTTIALGISDHGQVVGVYTEPGTPRNPVTGEFPARGFLWQRGVFTLIDVPRSDGHRSAPANRLLPLRYWLREAGVVFEDIALSPPPAKWRWSAVDRDVPRDGHELLAGAGQGGCTNSS
jgi:hypothetical protein